MKNLTSITLLMLLQTCKTFVHHLNTTTILLLKNFHKGNLTNPSIEQFSPNFLKKLDRFIWWTDEFMLLFTYYYWSANI